MPYNEPTFGESGEVYTDNVRNSLAYVKSAAEAAQATADNAVASIVATSQTADEAKERAAAAEAFVQSPTDDRIASLVEDSESVTRGALDAAFEPAGLSAATEAVLSATYAAKADHDALALSAVTTEELFINATFEVGTINTTRSYGLFVAPYAMRVAQVSLWHWDGPSSIALDGTNYWIITIDRYRAGAAANITAKGTQSGPAGNEAWAKRSDWNFDTASFNATNRDLQKGDIVSVAFNMTGTPGTPVKVGCTIRCEPI